uniref:Uncharacterized protein n=1 Tax=Aegilops tauschii TaxID=37682 RepID=M8BZY7_AEGTA
MLRRRLCATLSHHQGDTRAQPPPEDPVLAILQSSMGVDLNPYPNTKLTPLQRCSPDSPPLEGDQHSDRTGASGALKAMVCDMFRPLVRNISDIRSLRTVFDLEDYQVGMLFGAFLGCVGCYQLWKAAPSIFVDAALAYAFYKLSVVSSEVRRQGKCNDLLTRLKFGIVVIMATKDFRKNYELLDIVKLYLGM